MRLLIRKVDAVFVCDACGTGVYWYFDFDQGEAIYPSNVVDTLECVGCGARHSVELLTSRPKGLRLNVSMRREGFNGLSVS